MSEPNVTKPGQAPADTFLYNGVPTSVQAVKDGQIPGLRWNEETQQIQSARKVDRNGYGLTTYSMWEGVDSGQPESNYTVNSDEGLLQIYVSAQDEDGKAFEALAKIGESYPLRQWLSGEGRSTLEEWSDLDSMDLTQIRYEYQQFLASNPTFEDRYYTQSRGGLEPGWAMTPDLEGLKQAVYQGLTDAITEQYAKIAKEQIDAINEQTKALEEIKRAQEMDIALKREEYLKSENLMQFIGRKLTEGGEGQTKSWEDFFNRVLPRLNAVGNIAQSGIETYEYLNAPTDPVERRLWMQQQRIQARIVGGYEEMLKQFNEIATEQTLAKKVQLVKQPKLKPYAKTKFPKYRVQNYAPKKAPKKGRK